MADFNISTLLINSTGWDANVIFQGQGSEVGNTTYEYGLGANNDPANAKITLSVSSFGFNELGELIAIDRIVYGTETVRFPYPFEDDKNEQDDEGDLSVRISLSEFIYPGDNVTYVVDPGYVTLGGGDKNLEGTGTATNNSTLDYPKALGKWDNVHGTMMADRVTGSSFDLCVLPVAGHGVAAVKLTVIDQATGLETFSGFANTPESVEYTVSGLFAFCHRLTIPLAGFSEGLLDCRFQVYPNIGDADSVFDTDDFTTPNEEAMCHNKITVVCDKGGIGETYAVVATAGDTPAGNDGTGVASTNLVTASASPFLTWPAAKDATPAPNIIYFQAGAFPITGASSSQRNTDEWVRAMPHPDTSKANVTLAIDDERNYRAERASFEDLTIIGPPSASGYGFNGENANSLRFRDCTFATSGTKGSFPLQFGSLAFYVLDCDGDLCTGEWSIATSSGGIGLYAFEGNRFTATSNAAMVLMACMVGCHLDGGWTIDMATNVPAALDDTDGVIFAYNKIMTGANIANGSLIGLNRSIFIGVAVLNNVMERLVSGPPYSFGDALNASQTWNNIIVMHNTWASDRWNGPYNDIGSTPGFVTNVFAQANLTNINYFKSDTFGTPNAARVGIWSAMYGCGYKYGVNAITDDTTIKPEFTGILSRYPATQLHYVADKSFVGDAEGNGDYHMVEGNDAIGLLQEILLPFDIEGNARFIDSAINGGAAGAFEFGEQVPEPGGGDDPRDRFSTNLDTVRERFVTSGRF
jgi:hypothetical protein